MISLTRPVDWLAFAVIGLSLAILLAWGVFGRIPTRVAGEGIFVGDHGKIVDVVAASGGRLATIDVAIGDKVIRGQSVAHLAQPDIQARQAAAAATLEAREREHAQLLTAIKQEQTLEASNLVARKADLHQGAAKERDQTLTLERRIQNIEKLLKEGYATRLDLDRLNSELNASRQRAADLQNELRNLEAERLKRQMQWAHDQLQSQSGLDDARLAVEQLADADKRETRVLSPIAGEVTEIKVSPGAVLSEGAPVAAIATTDSKLQVLVYLPAQKGKLVKPGMPAMIAPTNVKREEYGVLLGSVVSVSQFPATPEGMSASLHNQQLLTRFQAAGALHATVVQLTTDATTPSGYRWSFGQGPPMRITAGTLTLAEVETEHRRPVDLLLPIARHLSGSDR